jgi:protein gp37
MNTTPIEWTDYSVNPFKMRMPDGTLINVCIHKSDGCRNCYAEMIVRRWWKKEWGEFPGYTAALLKMGTPVLVEAELHAVLRLSNRIAEGKADPKENKIFWNDMTDEYLEFWPDEFIDRCFAVRALTPNLIHQVLTKRIDRAAEYFKGEWHGRVAQILMGQTDKLSSNASLQRAQGRSFGSLTCGDPSRRFLSNVWLGISAEDQKTAEERIPILMHTPAAKTFISAEPLLGPIDLEMLTHEPDDGGGWTYRHWNALDGSNWCDCQDYIHPIGTEALSWVIVGGESGPGARPMHPDWARSLRDQCLAAGVPFFFKQWGEFVSVSEVEGPGAHHYFPDGATVRRVGKKAAGRLLDGREWSKYPSGISNLESGIVPEVVT